jgi:hypothetical protein
MIPGPPQPPQPGEHTGVCAQVWVPCKAGLSSSAAQTPSNRCSPAAEHVKEKWAKDLYIAGIAYGRTVT